VREHASPKKTGKKEKALSRSPNWENHTREETVTERPEVGAKKKIAKETGEGEKATCGRRRGR